MQGTNTHHILKGIDLQLSVGETVALVGPSGAGKSTIADLVLGLFEPSKGKIEVDGRDLSEIDLHKWRESIGVVDQEIFLLNASVKENIAFARPTVSLEEVKAFDVSPVGNPFITPTSGFEPIPGLNIVLPEPLKILKLFVKLNLSTLNIQA